MNVHSPKNLLFGLLAVITSTSCELIIDADVPYGRDHVVVNAIQEADSLWSVDLTRTRYILQPTWSNYQTIDNATVVVHKADGSSETLIAKGPGVYKGTTSPEIGKDYKITVDAPGLEFVEGSMTMPRRVKIIDIEWDSARMDDRGVACGCQRANVPFKITFTDPAGESNYYDVQVYVYSILNRQDTSGNLYADTIANFVQTYVKDPGITNDNISAFSDKAFDGKTHTIPMIAEIILWNGGTYYKTEVRFTSSNEEFYRYNETLDLQYQVMGDPFAQPVQVFSNMSNGFGIFSGLATDVMEWKADR
jgi:hypothetical protein